MVFVLGRGNFPRLFLRRRGRGVREFEIGEEKYLAEIHFPLSSAPDILSHDFSFLAQVLIDVLEHLSIFLKNRLFLYCSQLREVEGALGATPYSL